MTKNERPIVADLNLQTVPERSLVYLIEMKRPTVKQEKEKDHEKSSRERSGN